MGEKQHLGIISALIIVSVLFSQLGLNLMHTHQGLATTSACAFTPQADNGPLPCKACSLDVIPTLYIESFHLASPSSIPEFFTAARPADVLLSISEPSLGRAPPVR